MQKVMDFIVEYRETFTSLLAIVVAVVLFAIKKKPVKIISSVKELGLRLLPFLINDAEKTDLKGEDKLEYVFAHLVQAFIDEGYPARVIEQDRKYWLNEVEVMLSTPQKKEVNRCEK